MMKTLALAAFIGLVGCATADTIATYNYVNVNFFTGPSVNDVIPVTGYFQWDWTTNTVAGLVLSADGINFRLGGSYPANVTTSSVDASYDYQSVSYDIALVYTSAVTPTSGSTIDTTQSFFTIDPGNPATFYANSGTVVLQSAPEPAPFLALGVCALAALLPRRFRRATN